MALAQAEVSTAAVTRNCDKHGEYTAQAVMHGNRPMGVRCPQCRGEEEAERLRREKEHAEIEKRLDLESRFQQAMIPKRFQSKSLADYTATNPGQQRALKVATKYADNFRDRWEQGGGLVFCGKPGTGKSHLAAAIANHVIPTGATALWMTVMQAVRSVKETWGKDAERSERAALRDMLMPDLLILDEVGVQFGSEAERIILFEIINGRYQEMRPTILISNLPESELGDYLGERVLDRMREGGGAVVAFDWESHRK